MRSTHGKRHFRTVRRFADHASRNVSWRSGPRCRSTKPSNGGGSSSPARPRRRMISRATSSEISLAHRSAVLKGDDADWVVILAGHQLGNDGFQISPIFADLAICPAEPTGVVQHEIDGLIDTVRHDRWGPSPTIRSSSNATPSEVKHESRRRFCPKSGPGQCIHDCGMGADAMQVLSGY